LLKLLRFDRYRKFIKMAAAFNTLDDFLTSFSSVKQVGQEEPSHILMRAFVKNLDKTEGLEDGADVADSYASIAETLQPVAKRMLQNIQENYLEAKAKGQRKGMIIYNILQKLFLSADTRSLTFLPYIRCPIKIWQMIAAEWWFNFLFMVIKTE
jgi:hypothetical protein